jgi:hypothetical protein
MLVRYGRMNSLGLFEHSESQVPKVPARVVVKTDKGLELATWWAGRLREDAPTPRSRSALFTGVKSAFQRGGRKIIRFATPDDISEQHLRKSPPRRSPPAAVRQNSTRNRIVDAEHIFGGEALFTSWPSTSANCPQARPGVQTASRQIGFATGRCSATSGLQRSAAHPVLSCSPEHAEAKMQGTRSPSRLHCGRSNAACGTRPDLHRSQEKPAKKNTWSKRKGRGKMVDISGNWFVEHETASRWPFLGRIDCRIRPRRSQPQEATPFLHAARPGRVPGE